MTPHIRKLRMALDYMAIANESTYALEVHHHYLDNASNLIKQVLNEMMADCDAKTHQ